MTNKSSEYSDKELLALFRKPESREYAFGLIVTKYQEKLYWHIRKLLLHHHDTDDALQNTFLKVWTGLDNFREDSGLFTWLYRIATNESLSFLKSKKRRSLLPLTDMDKLRTDALVQDPYFNGDELQFTLQKALLTLPYKQRVVFNMKYFDDMKYEDMAEILDTSVGALKASFHHAVKKIEKYINAH
jgi:RNA polymerase sigma-70 factor (ECF subfamily)